MPIEPATLAVVVARPAGVLATKHASPYVSYFFCFGKIVDDFEKKLEALESKTKWVNNDVFAARRQSEDIESVVQKWLQRAEKELREAQKLEVKLIERLRCFNWCPNWGWQYCLSKKVAKKTRCISELLETPLFSRVGYRPPLQGIEFLLPEGSIVSESSKVAFNGIMRALNSDGVNMIGLHGMPGVGKTTLVEAVGKQARKQKLFDTVVMVTVSQTPNIKSIQDKIAEMLGLKFATTTEKGRAEELWWRLKDENKIFIIVDDIWKEFKLQAIGIPFGSEQKGCKILLTTRDQQVCIQMNCQENFQLDILSEDEAWALFKDKAGLKDDSSTLNGVAKEVAHECKGLPLAIVTIGGALKGERLDGWRAANKRLKESRHLDNEDVSGDTYKCLKLSYDYLKGDSTRSCLLLCSLFPEDDDIPIELLIIFGIGHGLFYDLSSIEDLRMEIRGALTKLQKCGLLLETDDEDTVRMHDVVRDFSHWLTSKGEDKFMVKDGLTEWPRIESFGCYEAISLWACDINNFPEKLEFPKLKTLILKGKNSLRVPSTFFEGMKALTVLFLADVSLSSEALQYLRNVRTLWFLSCQLENISSLRNMKNLEILAFWNTKILELPEELVELPRLKSLYFSDSEEQHSKFLPKLLPSSSGSLQELHVTDTNNVNMSEVNSLSGLTALSFSVSTDQCCQNNCVFPKLQSYIIAVNLRIRMTWLGFSARTLIINEFSTSSLSAFENLFCNVEKLNLRNIFTEHRNLVPSVDHEGLNELASLNLESCVNLEYLIDTTQGPSIAFSNLVALEVVNMPHFKGLCRGQPPMRFLPKLETLTIIYCGKLQWVFQMDEMANIKTTKVELEENQGPVELSNLTLLELKSLPELSCIWKGPTHHIVSLRSLKTMTIYSCGNLTYFFSPSLAQTLVHLENLDIRDCCSLEHLIAEVENEDDIVSNMQHHSPLCWPKLKTLEISNCERLKYVFPMTLVQGLPYLEYLLINNCDSLEHLIVEAENEEEICVSNMQHHYLLCWPKLKTLKISYCKLLEYVFPMTLAQGSLPYLESLMIDNCDSLEHLIAEAENEDEICVSNKQHHYPLCCPKLESLKIRYRKLLKYLFPKTLAQGLPYLESLEITDSTQLMQVFDIAKEKDGQNHIMLQRLQLLRLENLGNLSRFCPQNIVFSRSLKELEVCNCPLLTRFKNHQGVMKEVPLYASKELLCNAINLIPNVDPMGLNELVFLVLKFGNELECLIDTTHQGHVSTIAFLNLVELVIENMTGLKMLCNGRFPKGFLQSLEKLEIRNCIEMLSLSPALQNLKEVRAINCGKLEEVFEIDESLHDPKEKQALLSSLTHLVLEWLPELKCIWKGPTQSVSFQSLKVAKISYCNRLNYLFSPALAQSLMLLEQLQIDHCDGLEHIIKLESGNGLPKLTILQICDCPALEYVFQIPSAQVLPQLKLVAISNSPQLKQVFNVAKLNEVDRPIALPRLQHLQLENLINLSCFCSETYLIVSPFLQILRVWNCPQLKIFTIQKEVYKQGQIKELNLFNLGNEKGCDTISFQLRESTSSYLEYITVANCENMFQDQAAGHFLSRVEFINLSYIHQWEGPIRVASLQYLRHLNVTDCNRLKSLFSFLLARNLPQLTYLYVWRCEELEEIIGMDQTSTSSSQGHLQPVSFPSLETIDIKECNNLKRLFPVCVTRSLSKVQLIAIEGTPKLEHVFGYEDELDKEENHKEIITLELSQLALIYLPSLKSFGPMGYHFQFHKLNVLYVRGCPKLTTSFSMDSKRVVHAIAKAPQQVENNTADGFTRREEIVDNQPPTCNDIHWDQWDQWDQKNEIPPYINVEETEDNVTQ